MDIDIKYMQRCLQLAENGLGKTYPNPMVGSVIVYNDSIIAEGFHRKAGENHAEVNAINAVKNKCLLQESTLYVNLEPCSHYGKTPPCADLIIEMGIPRVVIGTVDISSKVSGKGIERMQNSGIEVFVGAMEEESKELNKRFFCFHRNKRPYIILKWAQTLDSFIDFRRKPGENKHAAWITNELSRALVHKWRTEEQAIMVGTETALKDNPQLNVREWSGNSPLRISIDLRSRLNNNLNLFDQSQETIIYTSDERASSEKLIFQRIDSSQEILRQILNDLYNRNIQSLIVEGGTELLNSFIKENLWDEARVFSGEKFFGDGVKAPKIEGKVVAQQTLDDSKLFIYRNP